MAKKGFTPMIGLAVVLALALAAVFGAMSLTNPAFAAVGAVGRCRIGREECCNPRLRPPDDWMPEAGPDKMVNVTLTWGIDAIDN